MTTILIVEDHPIVADWTRQRVFEFLPDAVIDDAASVDEARSYVSANGPPDWVLLDLGLPDATELEALRTLRCVLPSGRIVVLSGVTSPALQRVVMSEGAVAFLHKTHDVETMTANLRNVLLANGRVFPASADLNRKFRPWFTYLTESEKRIVPGLREGLSNKQIAQDLTLALTTVKKRTRSVYRKAGLEHYRGNKRMAFAALFKENPKLLDD